MTVEIEGRTVEVRLSAKASNRLKQRTLPLVAEMELFFSCLLRKRVRFRDLTEMDNGGSASDNLVVTFRPVMTRHCGLDYFEGDEPPMTDFPIVRIAPYVPHWLSVDWRGGEWVGEFGYANNA